MKLNIPKGEREGFKTPFKIKSNKMLVICDLHIPYHDEKAIEIALTYDESFDTLLIDGDLIDFHGLSKFQKRPSKIFIKDEIETTKEFLDQIRKHFKDKRIIYKFGNHDDRLRRWVYDKAPALYEVEEIKLENLLKLQDYKIEKVEPDQKIQSGKLNIIHGHEYRGGASINLSRSVMLKTFDHTLFGHFHTVDYKAKKKIDNHMIGSWAVGCLCGLTPQWLPNNEWLHGFALIEFDNGSFHVHNKTISTDYHVY